MLRIVSLLAALAFSTPAWAGLDAPPQSVDLTQYVKVTDLPAAVAENAPVKLADMTAMQALIPTAAATVPPIETVAGAAGSAGTYRPGTAVQPRISRATTVTTIAGGLFSGTWVTALASSPNIILTPIWAGSGNITCFLTSAPTTTAFAGKCTVDQSAVLGLSIVTAGLTVGPVAAASGVSVQVVGLPPTQ